MAGDRDVEGAGEQVRLSRGWKAAGLAVGVFVLGHAAAIGLLGQSSQSRTLQLLVCVMAYLPATLAIFHFLEWRELKRYSDEADSLADASAHEVPDFATMRQATPLAECPQAWTLDFLHQLEWKRTIALCLAYFEDRFRCETASLTEQGGVDIRLFRPGDENPAGLVHCQVWGARTLELDVLEAFAMRMARSLIYKGFCICFGGFSDSAKEFAQAQGLTLIDGPMFVSMLNRLPEERRQSLLSIAGTGDFSTPSCPVCGLKMIASNQGAVRYWGCRAFPRCKGALPLRPYLHSH